MSTFLERVGFWLATWFGCGYSPFAPGTAGSLAGLASAWLLYHFFSWHAWMFAALALLWLAPAIWASQTVATAKRNDDPQLVVIDEVLGQWITLAGVGNLADPLQWAAAFALFRFFDIWKPWPVRRLEHFHGGYGIVMDDCVAGVYGAVVLYIAGPRAFLQ